MGHARPRPTCHQGGPAAGARRGEHQRLGPALAALEQTDTARFDTFIAKRQPIKTSLDINPKQLYEYRDLADELTRIAKEELA